MKRTSSWRSEETTQLVLSYLTLHKGISSFTVSHWVKDKLRYAGLNIIEEFTGHSTRSSSTSKAALQGLSCKDIYCKGEPGPASPLGRDSTAR